MVAASLALRVVANIPVIFIFKGKKKEKKQKKSQKSGNCILKSGSQNFVLRNYTRRFGSGGDEQTQAHTHARTRTRTHTPW